MKTSGNGFRYGLPVLVLIFSLAGFLSGPLSASAEPAFQVRAVHLLSGPENGPATDVAKTPARNEAVFLFAAIECDLAGRTIYFCPSRSIQIQGKTYSAQNWDAGKNGNLDVEWFKVEWNSRHKASYNNTRPRWHWDTIDYKEVPFRKGDQRLMRITADCRPTLLEPRANLGTMRFKVTVKGDGFNLSTPGREKVWRGGISDLVHRISRRGQTGEELLDWAQSFYNLPYIWGSSGSTDSDHQSERYVGADCADLVVAAARRAGYSNIRFGSTKTMKKYCESLGRVAPDPRDGRFIRMSDKKPLRFGSDVRPGDLIFGNRHVGFLAKDRGRRGWLDKGDLVMHTFFKPPREEPIGKMQLFAHGFELLRLRRDVTLSEKEIQAGRQEPEDEPGEMNRDRTHRRSVFSR